MNSFDLMIERYKQEMKEFENKVNANRNFSDFDEAKITQQNEQLQNQIPTQIQSENVAQMQDEFDFAEENLIPVVATMAAAQPQILQGEGSLIVQAFMSSEVYPIVSALVQVRKNGENDLIFEGYTDVNGKTDAIKLPAPSAKLSQQPSNIQPYSLYDIEVSQPKYKSRKYIAVPVFDEIESIQPVQLVPVFSSSVAEDVIITAPPTLGGEYNG